MGKEVKAAFGLVVLSNLAMIDAFVAIQEVLSEDQSKVLLEALDRVNEQTAGAADEPTSPTAIFIPPDPVT